MTYSFIIVNYNTKDLLKKCIENLLSMKAKHNDLEIIVVDNLSFDGSVEMIEYEFKDQVILIKNNVNNLPIAHNLGVERSQGQYIIHLGSDCYPTYEAINQLKKYCENNIEVGICTGKLINKNGEIDWDSHRGITTPWSTLTHFLRLDKRFPKSKLFNSYFLGYKDMSQPHEIGACISHFMFIPKTTYQKVGKWDTDYFMYGEDIDFCYRVIQAGLKIMYLPNIEILHLKGGGVGRKTTDGIDNASRRDYNHMKKVSLERTNAMKIFYKKRLSEKHSFLLNSFVYLGIDLLKMVRKINFLLKGGGY